MKNKILIFGKGFIGERLKQELDCKITDKKIYSYNDAQQVIDKHKPKMIINCIGFTGKKNVDGCEEDIEKTLSANVFVPVILAEAALRNNIKLIHISSGCIYHYDYKKAKPIDEEKIPDFFKLFYSRSKIYADRALEVLADKYKVLIIRIRIPLDNRPHPRNTLTKLISYKKIIDIPNSVTYIPDFILALKHLIKIKACGVYNVVNKGGLLYHSLLNIYKKYQPDYDYQKIDYSKLNLTRTNLIMSTKKLELSGFKVRPINEVLEECVKQYLKY